jgi:hypothetical protein
MNSASGYIAKLSMNATLKGTVSCLPGMGENSLNVMIMGGAAWSLEQSATNLHGIIELFSNQNKRKAMRIFLENDLSHGYVLTIWIQRRREILAPDLLDLEVAIAKNVVHFHRNE